MKKLNLRRKHKRHYMEPTQNQTTKALAKNKLLIVAGVVILIIISAVFIANLVKNTNKPTIKVGSTDGVFTSFAATATGTVTKISGSDIEIENNGVKKSFKFSENLLITYNCHSHSIVIPAEAGIYTNNGSPIESGMTNEGQCIPNKNLVQQILGLLIPEVEAQFIPPRPELPDESLDTKSATNSGGIPNIPPAPRKSLEDIKVGDLVNLNLVKAGEADDWIVTGISVLP